jgi:predicted MFS family arabinose efflux permease
LLTPGVRAYTRPAMNLPQNTRKTYTFLVALALASAFGFQGWRTLFNNFAVDVGRVDGLGMGFIQSVREIPGFLALLVVYLLRLVPEHRLAVVSVVGLGASVALAGLFPSLAGLTLTTLGMSFGFHYYETVSSSMTLQHFDRQTAPVVAGRLRSFNSAGNLVVGGIIFLAADLAGYPWLFAGIGLAVILAALFCLRGDPRPAESKPQELRMVLRRRYWLFYALTFFAGARRQIFVAFALFLMVSRFGFTVREITALFVLNNLIMTVVSPYIGKAIARFGERRVLTLEYLNLIWIFLAYAFTDSKAVVAALYILDHLFFNFAIAIKTFFQKIGDPAHMAPTMAVGFTINHIAAVVIPVAGGALWMLDYRIPFLAAAGMACVSLALTQLIRVPDPMAE